nr:AMP-binding protein [Tessaracoccus coleopterorum]
MKHDNSLDRPWVRHYQPGVPAEIEAPTESLVGLYERSVAEGGDAVALEFFGRETTYTELGDQIARAAEGLRKLGVKAGDRVALILPNSPQHVVAFYAVLRLGAVVVEHNPSTPRANCGTCSRTTAPASSSPGTPPSRSSASSPQTSSSTRSCR